MTSASFAGLTTATWTYSRHSVHMVLAGLGVIRPGDLPLAAEGVLDSRKSPPEQLFNDEGNDLPS